MPNSITIRAAFHDDGEPIETQAPVLAWLAPGVALHREMEARSVNGVVTWFWTGRYALTHVPSGLKIATVACLGDAFHVKRRLAEVDWTAPAEGLRAQYAARLVGAEIREVVDRRAENHGQRSGAIRPSFTRRDRRRWIAFDGRVEVLA